MSDMKLLETDWKPSRESLLDSMGRPITQSMFLEVGYSEAAIYTLKDIDWEWNGKTYPSMKRLYILEEDPTEYEFATKYLLGWKHWIRICENKLIRKYIDEWRDELEIKLRSKAVKEMIKNSSKGKIVASKWLADKGWSQRGAGRPTKAEIETEKKFQANIADEFSGDVARLRAIKYGTI